MKKMFSKHVALKGSNRPVPDAKQSGKINKRELMNVSVKIRPKEALPDLLDPKVFKNFKPLTHEEFASKYSSTEADIKIVSAFAHHTGLSIVKTEPAKKLLNCAEQCSKWKTLLRLAF